VIRIILVLVLLCSFTLPAQDKTDVNSSARNNQLEEWMDRISSDPGMRADMVALMVYKTKDNKEDFLKLAELFTRYPELNKMLLEKMPRTSDGEYALEPRGTDNNSKLTEIKPVEAMPKK
jgi:hypothetical protein